MLFKAPLQTAVFDDQVGIQLPFIELREHAKLSPSNVSVPSRICNEDFSPHLTNERAISWFIELPDSTR